MFVVGPLGHENLVVPVSELNPVLSEKWNRRTSAFAYDCRCLGLFGTQVRIHQTFLKRSA